MEQIANRFDSALTSKKHDWSRQRVVRMALAASLIAITTFSIWYFISGSNNGPFFEPRSVVAIYQETVDRGFKPYYECHDMPRFAEKFFRLVVSPVST